MDDMSKKREAVMSAYNHPTWRDKVKNMTDSQVTAIFLRLKAQNKI
jgi:hypothetical protein